jgi:hypothetical protein
MAPTRWLGDDRGGGQRTGRTRVSYLGHSAPSLVAAKPTLGSVDLTIGSHVRRVVADGLSPRS